MRNRSVFCLLVVFIVLCCSSLALGQVNKKIDAESLWMYHPDKDKYLGSYEWWYMDAHLDNGLLLAIVFGVPNQFLTPYNKYLSDASKLLPLLPYNPKDFATVEFSITDAKGNVLFDGYEDVKAKDMHMPTKKNMIVKFNNSQIEMKKKNNLGSFTFTMNLKDRKGENESRATLVLDSLVPTTQTGRGHCLDAVVDGKHLSHESAVFASTAKVKADITITDKKTGKTQTFKEKGFGYHDKNWGNHAMKATLKGWIWTRIAEEDLTVVFAEVPNIYGSSVFPTYLPCTIVYKGKIIAATEALDIIKGPVGKFRLPCPTEMTVVFKPESGIKGTLKYYDLTPVICYEGSAYSRWTGKYALDIDSANDGKIKRDGTMLFEYVDFTVKQ